MLALVRDQLVHGYDAERLAETQRQKREAATARARAALASGPAELQDTFEWLLERAEHHLPVAPVQRAVGLPQSGVVDAIDARALGLAGVAPGGRGQRAAPRRRA